MHDSSKTNWTTTARRSRHRIAAVSVRSVRL